MTTLQTIHLQNLKKLRIKILNLFLGMKKET